MVKESPSAHLLATAVRSFDDRRNISRRPPYNFSATTTRYFGDRQKAYGTLSFNQ